MKVQKKAQPRYNQVQHYKLYKEKTVSTNSNETSKKTNVMEYFVIVESKNLLLELLRFSITWIKNKDLFRNSDFFSG